MNIPPLAIVQARIASTRLPDKMLADLGGKPLVRWAWEAACSAFGADNVVCAIPASAENAQLGHILHALGAEVFRWDGPEDDVLSRLWHCAHRYRWHPQTVIVRVTPDDPFKLPGLLREVASGIRHPVELGGEAFTLEMLDRADLYASEREHITRELFRTPPPPAPKGIWTVDTPEDLEAARNRIARVSVDPLEGL